MYKNFDIRHDLKTAFEDGYLAGVETAQPKWISVEDRLPKQYVSVLVYMPDEYPRPTVHEGYVSFIRNGYEEAKELWNRRAYPCMLMTDKEYVKDHED